MAEEEEGECLAAFPALIRRGPVYQTSRKIFRAQFPANLINFPFAFVHYYSTTISDRVLNNYMGICSTTHSSDSLHGGPG